MPRMASSRRARRCRQADPVDAVLPRVWPRLLPVLSVACVGLWAACATPAFVDHRLDDVRSVALVSLHAPHDIDLQDSALVTGFVPPGLGAELIEMIEGDVEGDLETRFGAAVIPLRRAGLAPATAALPAATPADAWAAPYGTPAIDLDAADLDSRLGTLARQLGVDAVVVLRHEWWLSRVRFARSIALHGHDRCTVLVVDAAGRILWRDVVVTQVAAPRPVLLPGPGDFGVGVTADDARSLARRATRQAWQELLARARRARATASTAAR